MTRNDLLKILPTGLRIIELGVFKGDYSKIILETCKPTCLYLVDTWSGSCINGDKDGHNIVFSSNLELEYNRLCEEYKNNNVVKLYRCSTANFFYKIEDKSVDFIYIDADHSEWAVYADLCFSLRKSCRFIGGHDYGNCFKSVTKAVNRFITERGLKLSYLTDDECQTFLIDLNGTKYEPCMHVKC